MCIRDRYDSIHKKLFPLADDVIVYPAHGPGSSCGKNLGPNTYSTIGEEKQFNYAMKAETKKDFIKKVTDGIAPPPSYFPVSYTHLDVYKRQACTY